MTARNIPRIETFPGRDDREGLMIQTPYHEGFVESLKSAVPWRDRAWDSSSKTWWVALEHEDALVELVVHHFGDYALVRDDGSVDIVTAGGEVLRQGGLAL